MKTHSTSYIKEKMLTESGIIFTDGVVNCMEISVEINKVTKLLETLDNL